MTDTQFKVGDLVYFDNERPQFAIVYETYEARSPRRRSDSVIRIFFQIQQTTTVYYASTLKQFESTLCCIHYPSETK